MLTTKMTATSWKNADPAIAYPPPDPNGLVEQHQSDSGRNRAIERDARAIEAKMVAINCIVMNGKSGREQ